MKNYVSTKYGFTLIELLVVISIIALLIAILLPALGAARRSAQTIQCASNNRQMAIASLSFEADNQGYIPIAGKLWNLTPQQVPQLQVDRQGNPMTLVAILAEYMDMGFDKSTTVALGQDQQDLGRMQPFLCPLQSEVPTNALYLQFVPTGYAAPRSALSFGFNEALFGNKTGSDRIGGNINRVKDTSRVMLFGDAKPRNQSGFTTDWITFPNREGQNGFDESLDRLYTSGYTAFDLERHQGNMNISFLDGHGETAQPESFEQVYLSKGID